MSDQGQRRDEPSRTKEPAARYDTARTSGDVWAAFEALTADERSAFLARLLEDDDLREDLLDSIVMIERRGEPSRPYDEFVEDLRREGRL